MPTQKARKTTTTPLVNFSLERVIASVSEKMQLDFAQQTAQIRHKGVKGYAREAIVRHFLEEYLPKFLSVGAGEIICTRGDRSMQTDLIIHDKFHSPNLIRMDDTRVFPVESVYAVIEVKSRLGKKELIQSVENIRKTKSLPKVAFYPWGKIVETYTIYGKEFDYFPMMGYLFAFTSSQLSELVPLLDKTNTDLGIAPEHQIDVICVLNKGVVAHVRKDGKLIGWPEPDTAITWVPTKRALLLFYLFMMGQLSQARMRPLQVKDYIPETLTYGPEET